jgi:hypothetical protein
MRIASRQQANAISIALDASLDVKPDAEPADPSWIEIDTLDSATTEVALMTVRYPGSCMLSGAQLEASAEKLGKTPRTLAVEEHYTQGVFVVVLDEDGHVVFVRHTAVGALPLLGERAQPKNPIADVAAPTQAQAKART